MIYRIIKFFLFMMPPERAHHFTTSVFGALCRVPVLSNIIGWLFAFHSSNLECEFFGLKFKNPVGLAAGFDKDGKYLNSMSKIGFGFIEVGTVTPRPQIGNPKPRMFRLPKDEALINRMGFNNEGVDYLVTQLKSIPNLPCILGGNIGKNKDTPNEDAHKDYLICFEKLYPYVDYFVVNLSSPNTPGLRSLQSKDPMKKILLGLCQYRSQQAEQRPILVKISPDLQTEDIQGVVEVVKELGVNGIIATNTTISREDLQTLPKDIEAIGPGGLSGLPLLDRSTQFIQNLRSMAGKDLPIVGVGGINSVDSAKNKFSAGANLIQVYTGFVYQGPALIKRIKKGLVEKA